MVESFRWGGLLALLCVLTTPVRADESSGRWSGVVEARGNYYWERSTRVIAPTLSAQLDSPGGTRFNATYLVDTITSASQATGVIADVAFTEVRHEVLLGSSREFRIASLPLRLGVLGRVSREPDYLSLGGGINTALFLDQRATTLRFDLFYTHDRVSKILRGFSSDVGGGQRDIGHLGDLDSVVLSGGIDRILSRSWTATLGYDFNALQGFLANPYRQVPVQGVLRDEKHPEQRLRHSAYFRFATYLEGSGTAIHLLGRAYVDSWDIAALTPELRIYQDLGKYVQLRGRYRHYTQTRAYFAFPNERYVDSDTHVTADPKMTRFHNHLLGGQLAWSLGFIRADSLSWLQESWLDFSFEYIWNTNRFGNGVISQLGLRTPF